LDEREGLDSGGDVAIVPKTSANIEKQGIIKWGVPVERGTVAYSGRKEKREKRKRKIENVLRGEVVKRLKQRGLGAPKLGVRTWRDSFGN
jgi:hypothetical protein